MTNYQHTQTGTVILVALGLGFLITAPGLLLIQSTPERIFLGAIAGLFLFCLFAFRSLSVSVNTHEVAVWFGSGLIKKRFQITDIVKAKIVRNSWYNGFGIRLVPHGLMFNISGLDAVELKLGEKHIFRIGTDDPEQLLQAISNAKDK